MEQEKQLTSLPENAYRELKPGEEYTPIMPASSNAAEWTGLVMYLALIGYFGWHTLRAKKEE